MRLNNQFRHIIYYQKLILLISIIFILFNYIYIIILNYKHKIDFINYVLLKCD